MSATAVLAGSVLGGRDEAVGRRELRRGKAVALAFLLAATVVFLGFRAWELHGGPAWAAYVRAAAEAGMVGALADWFAVTALFRHPLGIPIPHTAIIPTKKDALGHSLSDFVGSNFLAVDVITDKLRRAQVPLRFGRWLAQRANADRATAELATMVRGAVAVLRDEDVQAVIDQVITRRLLAQPWGPALGKLLGQVLADAAHSNLVDLVCDRAYDWVRDNHESVARVVSEHSPSWSPRFVDDLLGDKVYSEVLSLAWEVKTDPDHPMRKAVDGFLSDFAEDLQHDPDTIARAEQFKRQILAHPEVHGLISAAWSTAKTMLLDAAEDPSSELRLRVTETLMQVGRRLVFDAGLREKLDGWLADAAGYVVRHYAAEITTVITDTVERWDGAETARKVELQVGRDLQFIRINGTVVGAFAGLLIYTISQLVL